MKKKINLIFAIFLFGIISSLAFTSAEFWECFGRGERINFCNPAIPDRTCSSDLCKFCMNNFNSTQSCYNGGNFNVCNGLSGDCANIVGGGADISPPTLTINNPLNNSIHTSRSISVDLDVDEDADISYLDVLNGRGRWIKVCNDCSSYSRRRNFKEGLNQVRFMAIDNSGNEVFKEIFFTIDSKKPRIHKIDPKQGFASGDFMVQYSEDNLDKVKLYIGNSETGPRIFNLTGCFPGQKQFCDTSVNLNDYNGEMIEYYFTVKDKAGNEVESRTAKLKVDTTFPVINDINFSIDERRVHLAINITEENIEVVEYLDNSALRPVWKKLCSRLKDEKCEKNISLVEGRHEIDIQVIDKARNLVSENIIIDV
ncbi:MAG: hypothetical protein AABY07_02590 [Nanoarchaeota archaeon]